MKTGIKRNLKGAALIWVTLASTVVAIVAAGLIAVSVYYYNRAKSDAIGLTQSFLNCKSGVNLTYSYLSAVPSDDSTAAKAVYDKTVGLGSDESFEFTVKSDDGELISITVSKPSELYITITAESEASEEPCTLTARAVVDTTKLVSEQVYKDLTYVD